MKEVEPSPDRKIIKLLASVTLVSATTTLSLKLVVEWRRLSRFPAKMTLAYVRARQKKVLIVASSSSLYNPQTSIFISDHGKSWRIAGNITQRGSFEPDESQVVLQCSLIGASSFSNTPKCLHLHHTLRRPPLG